MAKKTIRAERKSNSIRRRIKHIPAGHAAKERKDLAPWMESFRHMHGRLFEQMLALQCASRTIQSCKAMDTDDDLGAALNLLQRTARAINDVHTELDLWSGDLVYRRTSRLVRESGQPN